MKEEVIKLIKKYLEDVSSKSSNYVVPFSQMSEQFPYYTEQEMTDTHIQLDSPQGGGDGQNSLDKQMVYDNSEWTNPSWSDGNFLEPNQNLIQREFNRTDNSPEKLYDFNIGASSDIIDLNDRTASAIDGFLSNDNYIKISSMDLSNFLKVSDDTLIHKSNKDLWKVMKDKEGNVYISRLFEGDILNEK